MSELLQQLTRSCFPERNALEAGQQQAALWQTWLLPVTTESPVGRDPVYHDDFQLMRDELNKLSGADTALICQLAESLLLTQAKDVRIATCYIWARLHRDGERGLAEGLALLAGLVQRFGTQLLPSRPAGRKMALGKAGAPWDKWTAIIRQDLMLLLERLPGLESLAWNDGTPFADEVTRSWITRQVLPQEEGNWLSRTPTAPAEEPGNDVLALEPEALALADREGVDAALGWLQSRAGIVTARQRLLLRLLMARIAEQYGKSEMALLLLEELHGAAQGLTLTQWEPELIFEVTARQLKLLRLRAHRYTDKAHLARKMENLLAALVAMDPARAAVLCDTQYKD